jgi:ribonucleoside-diphosphate reductase alpha chain
VYKNPSQEFVYVRTYSRWVEELSRRETWPETVDRYINFIDKERGGKIPSKVLRKIKASIINLNVMPSMRALWAAGEAASRDNTCMYNCSFLTVDSISSFSECLYILMCGTGVGFSVEKKYVDKLPLVPVATSIGEGTYTITDDKAGWADSLKVLLQTLYKGHDIDFDYSKIRKKGSKLKIMGGRASGPEPLMKLHNFVREVFNNAQDRRLTTLECHDIMNEIAEIVVVGGVRRSSQISVSDLDDESMRDAKIIPFPKRRFMANNSAIYITKPTATEFLQEWAALAASGSGERGIFNIEAARKNAPERRVAELIAGLNPCAEIMLRSMGFCNLSEIVVKHDDDLDDLMNKVETAVWIGVIQATFVKFPYLRRKWKTNCEEEMLLGVSITGQLDNPSLMTKDNLTALKKKAIKVAKRASKLMEVNCPVAITTGKPSGTVSQLVDCASGAHPRYSPFWLRRYRISSTDPLFYMLKDQGVPFNPEVGQREYEKNKKTGKLEKVKNWSIDNVDTWVLEFPQKAPENAVLRDHMTAIEQLEHYKTVQTNWCEHNQSMTVYVRDNEWFEVGNWVYKNWDIINGVSFLPFDGGGYELAPYEEIDKKTYDKLVKSFPNIDYSQLSKYEMEDNTEGSKSYACVGDKCELK